MMHARRSRKTAALLIAAASTGVYVVPSQVGAQTRAQGMDFSDYQGSNTNFANIKSAGYSFLFLRASRGGTTGTWNQSTKTGTGNFRYDDLYWIKNVNGAKAAGIYTGAYHFDRADSLSSGDSNATIIARAQEEADHLLQVAGPWIRPGYIRPVLDLEAGSGLFASQLSLFATTFADRIYQFKHVYPICYVNSSYANSEVDSTVPAKMPDLWLARPDGSSNHATGDPVPASSYPNAYGKWNPSYPNTPNPHPWKFWQDGIASGSGYYGDYNVAHGTVEWVKDFLVPVYWTANASGDWSTASNWNTDTDPNDAVTAAEDPENQYKINGVLNHNDVTRAGNAPASRLPGNISASNTTTGADDTVVLDNTVSAASYTVTLSSGSYNIRKFYVKRPFNLTGGSLTINYDPTTLASVGSSTALGSTTFSAQFSQAVSMTGGALSVHTLLVDASRTFTLSGGTVTLDTMKIGAGSTPGKLLVGGDVTINPLNDADAVITSSSTTNSATMDLGGGTRTITVGDGGAAVDLMLDLPVSNGSITKAGVGTLQLNKTATFNSAVAVNAGTLIATQNNQLGTGVNLASAGSLHLSGSRSYSIPLSIGGAGANGVSSSAPGNPGTLHALSGNSTWSGNVTLNGSGANGTDPLINQVSAASGATLTLSGVISSSASGAFAKSDNGDLVLTGSSPNTYTGITRLYGGRIIVEKDGALGTAGNHTYMLAGSASTIAFRAPASSPAGYTYASQEVLHTEGSGAPGYAQVDNLSGNNTFAGSIAVTGSGGIGSIGVTAGSLTVAGGLYSRSGPGLSRTINKTGTGTLILTGDSSVAAPAGASANILSSSTLNVMAGAVDLRSPSANAANVPGLVSYTVSAGSSLLNTAGTISDASIDLAGAGASYQQATGARLNNVALSVASGGTAQLAASGMAPSLLSSLSLTGTAKLDITSNNLAVDYDGASSADVIRQYLLSGRSGGAWTGSGLISSVAAGDGQHRTAIGYGESSLLGVSSWSGTGVDTSAVLLKYTWYGDANLDGEIDADDYALIDRAFAKSVSNAHWTDGDFNYDGAVNSADYLLIDRVFAQQSGTLSPGLLAQREAQFGSDYVSELMVSIPEPSSAAVLVLGAVAAAGRRRRK